MKYMTLQGNAWQLTQMIVGGELLPKELPLSELFLIFRICLENKSRKKDTVILELSLWP